MPTLYSVATLNVSPLWYMNLELTAELWRNSISRYIFSYSVLRQYYRQILQKRKWMSVASLNLVYQSTSRPFEGGVVGPSHFFRNALIFQSVAEVRGSACLDGDSAAKNVQQRTRPMYAKKYTTFKWTIFACNLAHYRQTSKCRSSLQNLRIQIKGIGQYIMFVVMYGTKTLFQ